MATVNVGSLHSASHSLQVFQSGQNFCDIQLKNDLFTSDSSEWVCSVESLQVPLDGTRYFSGPPHTELFNIRRLQHGKIFRPEMTHLFQERAGDVDIDIVNADPASIRAYRHRGSGSDRPF